jgi:PhnB protein
MLYVHVPNVDEVFNQAVAAGAEITRPLADQTYGERNGGFIDPFGHH